MTSSTKLYLLDHQLPLEEEEVEGDCEFFHPYSPVISSFFG